MIDYRELLQKYIRHVVDQEGVSFIAGGYRKKDRAFCEKWDFAYFEDEEWAALVELEEGLFGRETAGEGR